MSNCGFNFVFVVLFVVYGCLDWFVIGLGFCFGDVDVVRSVFDFFVVLSVLVFVLFCLCVVILES